MSAATYVDYFVKKAVLHHFLDERIEVRLLSSLSTHSSEPAVGILRDTAVWVRRYAPPAAAPKAARCITYRDSDEEQFESEVLELSYVPQRSATTWGRTVQPLDWPCRTRCGRARTMKHGGERRSQLTARACDPGLCAPK